MKNDPSMLGVSGHERSERDFYPTPSTATVPIFDILKSHELRIWEPACGDGAMSRVLSSKYKTVYSTDIHPMMDGAEQANFYEHIPDFEFDAIITNPPYGKEADKFIERMLYWVSKGKYAAILARNELDCAKSRQKYFRNCPHFMEKRVLLWRPRWVADSTGSPRHNYAWYAWGPKSYDAKITYAS